MPSIDAAATTGSFERRSSNRAPNPPKTDTRTPCFLIRAVQDTMTSSDDDEDFRQAIALSLQDQANGPEFTLKDAIALDSETEDDDEAVHTADNAQQGVHTMMTNSPQNDVEAATGERAGKLVESEGSKSTSSLSFLGIDRKKMEQERLARKRKVSISPPPPRKLPRSSSGLSIKAPDLQLGSGNNFGPSVFPRGTVKKTWAFGYPRTGDDIKLEEVLQRQDLNLAVLSSFQWDVEWLLAKINTRSMSVWNLQPGKLVSQLLLIGHQVLI